MVPVSRIKVAKGLIIAKSDAGRLRLMFNFPEKNKLRSPSYNHSILISFFACEIIAALSFEENRIN